ncbi:xanthine dehydrogenase small subunit [Salinicola sp. MH3R3-1]|uniref:xanthine dehydrogenase small subunit n=1 Tax=Salinicola sp. MH3R3-1 TaxID=1928762 RepID=UPI00094EC94C|nr:xanthine dehydrogenase small subunit [Salinicola sp. MH3R3-1]OLO06380.1 xanthine dehydrogenase small subunit [Salinicola sp. MH3R3-1]
MIEFFLNGQPQRVAVTPDTSVLELLRGPLGQCGTKEGCASGDCGACTVAIAHPQDGHPQDGHPQDGHPKGAPRALAYRTANACITPAHQLQGAHLITVEGLARGDALHPAQASMVACHGSQCGFCTPGIVMSLFALHEQQRKTPDAALDPHRLEASLDGNLCRCTGYRPIRDAALSMGDRADVRPPWADDPALEKQIRALTRQPAEADDDSSTPGYQTPATLAELIATMQRHPEAPLVAGATDLWLDVTQRLERFDTLIDLRQVRELRQIEEEANGWWIGAAVTYREWEPLLAEHYPAFAHLLTRLGSDQIRNRATVGGNIANASPIGDTPPVLLTLDARLRLAGPEGIRELPLESFFLDYKKTALEPGECVAAIYLPQPRADHELRVWKLSKRREDDISTLLGAFRWRLRDGVLADVRVAFGGMAATPLRLQAVEAALEGQAPGEDAFEIAKQALRDSLTPMSDARGSREYRLTAAVNLLERWRLTLARADSNVPTPEVALDAYAH